MRQRYRFQRLLLIAAIFMEVLEIGRRYEFFLKMDFSVRLWFKNPISHGKYWVRIRADGSMKGCHVRTRGN
jgi:hypothetical protein